MSQQINLFNPIFLKQKKYFSAVTMAQALGLILLGVGLMGVYVNIQLERLRPEANAVTAQMEAAQAQLTTISAGHAARGKDETLEADVRRTEAEVLVLQRVLRTLMQREVGNDAGYSEYMRAFSRQIVDGIWLTGFSIVASGKEISLSGRALRPELVPAYLNRLSSEPTMQGKSFGSLEMHSGGDSQVQATAGRPGSVSFSLRASEGGRPAGLPSRGNVQ